MHSVQVRRLDESPEKGLGRQAQGRFGKHGVEFQRVFHGIGRAERPFSVLQSDFGQGQEVDRVSADIFQVWQQSDCLEERSRFPETVFERFRAYRAVSVMVERTGEADEEVVDYRPVFPLWNIPGIAVLLWFLKHGPDDTGEIPGGIDPFAASFIPCPEFRNEVGLVFSFTLKFFEGVKDKFEVSGMQCLQKFKSENHGYRGM